MEDSMLCVRQEERSNPHPHGFQFWEIQRNSEGRYKLFLTIILPIVDTLIWNQPFTPERASGYYLSADSPSTLRNNATALRDLKFPLFSLSREHKSSVWKLCCSLTKEGHLTQAHWCQTPRHSSSRDWMFGNLLVIEHGCVMSINNQAQMCIFSGSFPVRS